MSNNFNNRVLCEECCKDLSTQFEQDNRRFGNQIFLSATFVIIKITFELRFILESTSELTKARIKSKKAGKSMDSSNMKGDESDADLYMLSRLRSSSTSMNIYAS